MHLIIIKTGCDGLCLQRKCARGSPTGHSLRKDPQKYEGEFHAIPTGFPLGKNSFLPEPLGGGWNGIFKSCPPLMIS